MKQLNWTAASIVLVYSFIEKTSSVFEKLYFADQIFYLCLWNFASLPCKFFQAARGCCFEQNSEFWCLKFFELYHVVRRRMFLYFWWRFNIFGLNFAKGLIRNVMQMLCTLTWAVASRMIFSCTFSTVLIGWCLFHCWILEFWSAYHWWFRKKVIDSVALAENIFSIKQKPG